MVTLELLPEAQCIQNSSVNCGSGRLVGSVGVITQLGGGSRIARHVVVRGGRVMLLVHNSYAVVMSDLIQQSDYVVILGGTHSSGEQVQDCLGSTLLERILSRFVLDFLLNTLNQFNKNCVSFCKTSPVLICQLGNDLDVFGIYHANYFSQTGITYIVLLII